MISIYKTCYWPLPNVPAAKELSASCRVEHGKRNKEVFDREQVYTIASFEEFITEMDCGTESADSNRAGVG